MNNLMIQRKVIYGFLSMHGGFIHYNMYRENITCCGFVKFMLRWWIIMSHHG